MCFAPQRRALFRHLNFQKWREHVVFCTFWLGNVLRAATACTFSTSQLPKVVREWCCFVHFDLETCFAPQRRALFRHLNFQKWSENGVFCTFWLGNVLRATTACTFSTSQLPKVVRTPQFLTHFTSKCASRHNGVQLFISHLPRCLRTRRFSEPTFQPSGATKPRKNTSVSRLSYLFAHLHLLSYDLFSSLTLLPADCFFISPYCRKFDFQTSFEYAYIHERVRRYTFIYTSIPPCRNVCLSPWALYLHISKIICMYTWKVRPYVFIYTSMPPCRNVLLGTPRIYTSTYLYTYFISIECDLVGSKF